MVVIGIIAVLLVAVLPAVTSVSKSGSRKAAMTTLLGLLEQARTRAITDGRTTYVAFATDLGTDDAAAKQRYSYRSYAIFQQDPDTPGTLTQLTEWKTVGSNVSLRATGPGSLAALGTSRTFRFAPLQTDLDFPYVSFDQTGAVQAPATAVWLGVFEGSVDGGNEIPTSTAAEYVTVARFTGRANYTPNATPTPIAP
jgi:Tfp pilus assembly protein FimT